MRMRSSIGAGLVVLLALSGCDSGGDSGGCAPGEVLESGECVEIPELEIALNSVGYLPGAFKVASVRGDAQEFEVRRTEDDAVAFTGELTGPELNADTGEEIWKADFSDLTETGQFYLHANGPGESPPFRIAEDAYGDALRVAMLGLYGQRCGTAVHFEHAGQTYRHGACHLADQEAELREPLGDLSIQDASGGWHDAGDYGKYTINGAFSVGYLLKAWEHFEALLREREFELPETGGSVPDFLDEMRWQLDWLLRMQLPDGSVSDILSTIGFADTVLPENDRGPRYLGPTGTPDAAALVATMAQAARIFEPFDADYAEVCRAAAQLSYDYLLEHPDEQRANVSSFDVGNYSGGQGYRMWALAEWWELGGDAEALAALEASIWDDAGEGRLLLTPALNWDWAGVHPLGLFTYLLSLRDGRNPAAVEALTAGVIARADELAENTTAHGYGRALAGSNYYYWGSNSVLLRTCMTLEVAYRLTGDVKYQKAFQQQVDHVLGRNTFIRSFVTGVGYRPASRPHHRPSQADATSAPWPGLLVGGPNNQQNTAPYPGLAWNDSEADYYSNEIAINWNAALIYGLAGLAR